jgi:proline-specific peptidase
VADDTPIADISPAAVEEPPIQDIQVPADDVTLHVRIAGDPQAGDVLIAVSGGPGLPSDMMTSLEELAGEEFAVVTYDQRGTGRSTKPSPKTSNYALGNSVEDLEAVRKALGAKRFHLLGRSWGGLVAMRYATLYPEQVRSMVLTGSAPPTWQAHKAGSTNLRARIGKLDEFFSRIRAFFELPPAR